MARARKLLVLVAVLGFVAFLAWTTLSAQRVECDVCVAFGSGRNCATATAASEKEAAQSAQTTACGPLAAGMDATIACGNVAPVQRTCRVK
jgi:predicted lipid-binding transport protein (Tim44 family)